MPTAAVAALALSSVLSSGQVADCLAAVINGRPITLVDLRLAEEFRIFEDAISQKQGEPRRLILEELINQAIVVELAREQVVLEPEEVEEELGRLRNREGEEAFRARLEGFGIEEDDLRAALGRKLLSRKVIALRFSGSAVVVSLQEIETYYENIYVPERRRAGAEPEPLIQAVDEIERRIKDMRREEQVAAWLQALRGQAEVRIFTDCLKSN